MKRKILIPLILLLLIAAGWFFWPKKQVADAKKAHQPKTETTENQNKSSETTPEEEQTPPFEKATAIPEKNYTFVLKPLETTTVRFPFSGRLEHVKSLKSGDRFSKNELLFQLDNSSLFNEISRRKTELKLKVEKLAGQLAQEMPEVYAKWQAYGSAITETDLLPALPENISSRERALIDQNGITPLSRQIQQKEQEMFRYFYLAPFDGRVQTIKVKPGKAVSAQQAVAVIYKEENMLLERRIHQKDLTKFAGKHQFRLENSAGNESVTLNFKTGKQTGDSVMISAKIPAEKLEKFDFFEKIVIGD